jgi:CRP-like cAMP-binding protein
LWIEMRVIELDQFRRLSFCASLSDRTLGRVVERLTLRRHAAGNTVFAQHDDQHDVYFVLAGHLRLTAYSMAGREVVFHDLHPGDLVGELSAIDGRPRSTNLMAVSDAELARLEVADFTRLLREEPDFAMAILQQLTLLVRKLNSRINLLTATVPTRICAELLRLASFNMIADNTARLVPAPRHLDIANRINTHREAVSRTISDLQRQHVVRRGQGELVILDVAALRRFADGAVLPTNGRRSATET